MDRAALLALPPAERVRVLTFVVPMPEEWRPVVGHPNYEVSNHGRVRRAIGCRGYAAGFVLTPFVEARGYAVVSMHDHKRRDRKVHRLVVEAFVGPVPPGMEVNHIDGDKTNNGVWNLEIVTPSENMRHAVRAGLVRPPRVYRSRVSPEQRAEIERRLRAGDRHADIARDMGVSRSLVSYMNPADNKRRSPDAR